LKGDNKGIVTYFPRILGCNMQTYLKLEPIRRYLRSIKGDYTVYIGIAKNEPQRYERLRDN
jgi:hypothetical protein